MEHPSPIRKENAFPDLDFPLVVKEIRQYHPLWLHRHEDFMEIVLVTAGRAVHRIGDRRIPIAAGDLMVIPGGWAHTYEEVADLYYFNILLIPSELRLNWADLPEHPGWKGLMEPPAPGKPCESFCSLDAATFEHCRMMAAELHITLVRKAPGWRFRALSQLGELLAALCDGYAKCKYAAPPDASRRISQVAEMLEQNCAKSFTVDQLCRKARMSRAALFREFKRYYNLPPLEYLMQLRIRQACRLLRDSDLAVGEIAVRCGFCDHSYFSLQFRRRMQMSPLAFRKSSGK